MTCLGGRWFGGRLTAFKFVHPALQCVNLPHQLLDGRLLCQGGTRQHHSSQGTANKTGAAHGLPHDQPDTRITRPGPLNSDT